MKYIDLETYPRRSHYEFFKANEQKIRQTELLLADVKSAEVSSILISALGVSGFCVEFSFPSSTLEQAAMIRISPMQQNSLFIPVLVLGSFN